MIINQQDLRSYLQSRVVGQEHAVQSISGAVARAEFGLNDPNRPQASFLLLGPTGVGKTELCHALADYLRQRRKFDLCILDMAEFQTPESIKELIGPSTLHPGGRLGCLDPDFFESGGLLLFDEIEKAHPFIQTLLLGPLDAARLTLGNGHILDLRKIYLAFTSNLAGSEIMRMSHASQTSINRQALAVAEKHFRPEVFNRFSEKVVFRKLGFEAQLAIGKGMVETFIRQLQQQKELEITYDEPFLRFVIHRGFNRHFGARPLREMTQRIIGDLIVNCWNENGAQRTFHFTASATHAWTSNNSQSSNENSQIQT